MNQIERIYRNIRIYIDQGALDDEFEIFAAENPDCDSISELNEIMESEMSYWAEDCEAGEGEHNA